ncbi:hypothetical protein RHGRI_013820 [Rhododendron griersonianum]|uniref:CCHC-type domain-containing protein n=1 Tax=Rhododendron griersonianum TaxID=479676 RepID=A0AAV6K7A8_9ERIC|nr:hypothetical protein RHGRI_013820 [Rhododendron griersonianum]
MAIFTEQFKKFFKKKPTDNNFTKKNSNNKGKVESSNGKDKKGIKGPPLGPKCYKCHGYGHVAHECINKLKKKTNFKANITWDDDSESEKSGEEREYNSNFIAFGASLHSHDSDHESSDDTEDEEGEEFEDSHELREKYDFLYKESLKINKTNLKLAEKYKKANMELAKVQNQFLEQKGVLTLAIEERDILRKEVVELKENIKSLSELNTLHEGKIKKLNTELANANNVFERLNTGSKKLDDILGAQRPTSDKSGLGFHGASLSNPHGSKVIAVKPKEVTHKSHIINIAKKPHDVKKANVAKFVPTCHYCNVKGHIRPNCFKLHGYPSIGFESFDHANRNNISHIKTSSKRGNVQKIWTNYAKYENVGNTTFKDMKPQPMANQHSQVVPIKTRSIWVRKSGLRPYTNLSITTLDDSGPSREVDLAFEACSRVHSLGWFSMLNVFLEL